MVTNLRIVGDEHFLPITADLRAELGIDASTPLDLRIEGGRLTVGPSDEDQAAAVDRGELGGITDRLLKKNAELYRRLA